MKNKWTFKDQKNIQLNRDERLRMNITVSIISKIVGFVIPIISVGIIFKYLDVELFGLWNAVLSMFAFFVFSDLGLGNGLQTKLSRTGELRISKEGNKLVFSTIISLIVFSMILMIIFGLCVSFVNISDVFSLKTKENDQIVTFMIIIVVLTKLISLPFSVVERVQSALQLGYLMEIASVISSLLSLMSTVAVVFLDLGPLVLFYSISLIPVIVLLGNFFIFFKLSQNKIRFNRAYFDKKVALKLLKLGFSFSVLSVGTMLIFNSDTFLISITCDTENTAHFSILLKLTSILSIVIPIMSAPLWGAFGEAIGNKDYSWIKDKIASTSQRMFTITLVMLLLGLPFVRSITTIWLGDTFKFYWLPFLFLALQQLFVSFVSPYFMYLNAQGNVRFQIILFGIFSVVSLPLKYFISKSFGFEFVALVGAIGYLVFILLPTVFYVRRNITKCTLDFESKR